MSWLLPLGVIAFTVGVGVLSGALVWYQERRRRTQKRPRRVLPVAPMSERSELATVRTETERRDDVDEREECSRKARIDATSAVTCPDLPVATEGSVHSAPTREFAVYVEELAALSMDVQAPTRELTVHEENTPHVTRPSHGQAFVPSEPVLATPSMRARPLSGFQPRTRVLPDRRQEDATLKVGRKEKESASQKQPTADELLRMLGETPIPDLGNIEIYYRLGLAYLEQGEQIHARRCFLIVEGISPGYRDAPARLAELSVHVSVTNDPPPLHRGMTSSGSMPVHRSDAPIKREPGRRNGR